MESPPRHDAPDSPQMPRWRRLVGSPLVPAALLAAAVTIVIVVWSDDERGGRQQKNIATLSLAGIALAATFIWFVWLAPVAWAVRRVVLITVLALILATGAAVRIDDVDGDLMPIVGWRCSPPPDRLLPAISPVTQPGNPEAAPASSAGDFPQFLGPRRSGVITGVTLATDWAAHPPRELWRRAVGAGWSGFAVVGAHAITQEQRGDEELVVCYDLTTGQPRWSHADETRYDTTIAGIGPRATPTIAGGKVFTLGATGILNCLDLATGRRIWSINVLTDTGAGQHEWGMSGSPLIEGDRVIVSTGGDAGTVAAYDAATGKRQWAAGQGPASYASPCIIELLGRRQLVMQNQYTITGHALEDGRVLWSHPTPGGHPKVAQPVPLGGDRLLVSSGYGTGSEAFELVEKAGGEISTNTLWKNIYLKSKFANIIVSDGYLYGLNDGTLTCLDADTGERAWRGARYGHGQLLLVGELLLLTAESGDIVLVKASPDGFEELSRFTAFDDKTWNSPTLAGRYLLVRNDREAACFELP